MNIEEVQEYCLSLPGVTEDAPYGPDWVVFQIGANMAFVTYIREYFVRVKVFVDIILHKELETFDK